MTFEEELRALINKYGKENTADTPDHILAKYLCNTLDIFNVTVNRRDAWYSKEGAKF